jgi:DNA-binding MarR family transcriptional regulator
MLNLGERITMVKHSARVEPVDETADALHSAAVRLLRRVRAADVGMDLDGPRASALSVVVYGGPLPLSRLAAAEQVSPPAMTKTVAALEAAGLVRRERRDADRRVVLVTATDAGRAMHARIGAEFHRAYARWVAALTPAECDALLVGLSALVRAMRADRPLEVRG